MSKFKKLICLLITTLLLFTFSVCVSASNETSDSNIKIEVATDKAEYKATSVAEITATITNVGDKEINNVTAQVVFGDLSPAGKKNSEVKKTVETLKAGESFSFTYKATLDKEDHDLNIFQKIILFFVRLFNGGYSVNSENFEVIGENITEIKFGKFTAKNIIQVGYDSVNSSVEENKPFSFSKEELATMEIVNTKITELTYSDEYKEYSLAKRKSEIEKILDELVENDLIVESSIIFNGEYNQFYFEYDTGIGYYIDIDEFEDHAGETETLFEDDTQLFTLMRNVADESNDSSDSVINNAIYIYGADDTDYNMVKKDVEQLNKFGLQTDLYSYLTANDYKTILLNYDLITIIEHGMEFWDDNKLALSLNEKQTTEKNKSLYADDLANKRILIENGHYCITPEFFSHYYKDKLNGCFVNLVSCQSMGRSGRENHRFSEAFADCGVSNVLGFHNSILYQYGLDFSIIYTERLFLSQNSKEAFDHAKEKVGKDSVDFVNKNIDRATEGLKNEAKEEEKNGTASYPIITSHYSNPFDFGTFTISVKDRFTNQHAKNVSGKIFWIEDTNELYNNNPNGHFEYPFTTDENGIKSDGLPIGFYGCIFNDENYKTEYITFTVEKGVETVLLEPIYLTPKSYLTGTVIDKETNKPVENASVLLRLTDEETGTYFEEYTCSTDKNGQFEIYVPVGTYTYTINKLDMTSELYQDATGTVTVNKADGNILGTVYLIPKTNSGDDNTGGEDERPITASGECGAEGSNVTWTLYEDGELVISGSGAMEDYKGGNRIPWYSNRDSLKKVAIEHGVTNVGFYSFYNCDTLTSVTIGDSVTSIGDDAFHFCDNLTSIEFSNSVISIGNDAFTHCKNLTSVEIPNSVTSIGHWAFGGCTQLTNITIPNSVTNIGNGVFYECINLTSAIISNRVTSIGDQTFYNCASLSSITIGYNVISIGESAFWCCDSLTNIEIPNSVMNIGDNAFFGCENLLNITIPNSVTSIGSMAFYGCTSLTNATISNRATSIGDYTFKGCESLISISIPDSVTSIGNLAFSGCESLISISIPDSVTNIGDDAFEYCKNLTSVEIPNSVTSIGYSAFYGCERLIFVKLPNTITKISGSMFSDCDSLKSIVIPKSVTSIGDGAFAYCQNLTSVEISNSVTSIGDYAFYYCSSLTDVYYTGTQEQWEAITIDSGNEDLTNATIHYNS